ncbi:MULTISPECIES: hypothetical protein [Gammaproteobacteria]|uniref:hypothetical protein n=1 Tax=Gammaproteobacteria TaxID=1236 RepID=UPI000DCF9BDA|nr:MULTISPECIES: hypothetical protein [Gammaproteobacteria]RTE87407.1 hypothetical protein DQX04_03200 [Aliidiomarina sp. B3213]TCZ92807.1 hypothetical protein EYQ95_02105 [Lysobacter sp. N42]
MIFEKGQAMLESSLFIGLVGLIVLFAFGEFSERLIDKYDADQQANIVLEQAWIRNALNMRALIPEKLDEDYDFAEGDEIDFSLETDEEYSSASVLSGVWSTLPGIENSHFPLGNQNRVKVLNRGEEWFSYRKINDSWSAKSQGDLSNAPRQFVTSHHISKLPFETVQQWVAILPFAREFGPSSLKLGWVDPEVVPEYQPEEH